MALMRSIEELIDTVQSIDPLKNPDKLRDLIWECLKPNGRPAPRAHLLTINGLTYPLQRDYCFAAVPDPSELTQKILERKFDYRSFTPRSKRRYSMLAYLFSIRPGDLIFFFQADPQPIGDIWNRRGFRGIWVVTSQPFRDITNIRHRITSLGYEYEILGTCPNCRTPFDFGEGGIREEKRCPLCGQPYGKVGEYSRVVLSARFLIKPLMVFKKTSGDNRVYNDTSLEPLIWISRTDNAMGPGKGSTIRTLLPEEAAKIGYMLATEESQTLESTECHEYPGDTSRPIDDYNNKPYLLRAVRENGDLVLEHEFHLNLYFAMNIDKDGAPIQRELQIPLNEVEYWTTEFPWGYTGDTADFVLSLWNDRKGRYKIYIFEFKKDDVDEKALAQVILYVPWVVQVLTQFRAETDEVIVQPVIVGKYIKLRAVPDRYMLSMRFFTSGKDKKVTVEPPALLQYNVKDEDCIFYDDRVRNERICYVKYLDLKRVAKPLRPFKPPPPTITTTEVEKKYVIGKYLNGF